MSVIKDISLEDKIQTIRQFSQFMQIDYEYLKPLVSVAVSFEFMRGDLIFREQDAPKFLFIVQKGRVKCFKQSGTGRNFVAYVANYGGSLNGTAVFSGLPHFLSAQAIEATILLANQKRRLCTYCNKRPETFDGNNPEHGTSAEVII